MERHSHRRICGQGGWRARDARYGARDVLETLRSELHRPLGTALETLRSELHRPLGTALETLRSVLHRLSGVVRVTGAGFAQLQSSPTGTSQSLHPADALAADEATIVQLMRDTADLLPIAPGEWQGPRVGLLG